MIFSRQRSIALICLIVALAACADGTLTSTEFAREYAETACEKAFACDAESMMAEGFADVEACRVQTTAELQYVFEQEINGNQCTFDGEQAARCLDGVQAMSCDGPSDELEAICDAVFIDCQNSETGIGQFDCVDGSTTIPGGWVCDGVLDCDDGSDEVNCGR